MKTSYVYYAVYIAGERVTRWDRRRDKVISLAKQGGRKYRFDEYRIARYNSRLKPLSNKFSNLKVTT